MSYYILHNCRHLHPGESDLGVSETDKGVSIAGFDVTQDSKCGYIQVPYNQLNWFINALTVIRNDKDYDPDSLEFRYTDPPKSSDDPIPFD